ncbi:MAG: hypothetical protein SFY56_10520 [Bacteroidota bacterium]|nr:hypothetical protein [Bacteroidota bacterium]
MKICFYISLFVLFVSCTQESKGKHITIKTDLSVADTINTKTNDTLTLLGYGEPKPYLYTNVEDVLEKQYTLKFIDVAGCVVTEELVDSVKQHNANTYKQLNTRYNRDIEKEISANISAEYTYLEKLDKYLRATQKQENSVILIYYVKKPHAYKAYYLFGQPYEKTLQYRIKSILEVDSATKEIINRTKKDELLPYNLKQLQYI